MLKLLSRSINVYVQFFISQFRLSQIQPLGLSKIQLSGLSQIARPTLKIHNNEEEDEPQGKSTHPYSDYPVHQAAPENHHKTIIHY